MRGLTGTVHISAESKERSTSITESELAELAAQTAAPYAKRSRRFNVTELRQVAWVSMLTTARRGGFTGGDPRRYLATAAYYALTRYVRKNRVSVSGAVHACWKTQTVSYHEWTCSLDHPAPHREACLDQKKWLLAIKNHVAHVLGNDRHYKLGLDVILRETTAKEAAQKYNLPVKTVYYALDRMRRKLRTTDAYELLRQQGRDCARCGVDL